MSRRPSATHRWRHAHRLSPTLPTVEWWLTRMTNDAGPPPVLLDGDETALSAQPTDFVADLPRRRDD